MFFFTLEKLTIMYDGSPNLINQDICGSSSSSSISLPSSLSEHLDFVSQGDLIDLPISNCGYSNNENKSINTSDSYIQFKDQTSNG